MKKFEANLKQIQNKLKLKKTWGDKYLRWRCDNGLNQVEERILGLENKGEEMDHKI